MLTIGGQRVRMVVSCPGPFAVAILFFVLDSDKKESLEQRTEENQLAREKLLKSYVHNEELLRLISSNVDSIQEFLDLALDRAIRFTDSKDGYLFFYDEPTEKFTVFSWVLSGLCNITK